jgi:farnesyl diphosphate synthase
MAGCVASVQMLDYNVPGGKLNRGMAVYDVLASIKGAEVGTSRRTHACVCGWWVCSCALWAL